MNYFMLIFFNIVFFMCNQYPKHILEFNSWLSVAAVLLNTACYFVFFLALSIMFKRNKTPLFSKYIFSPLENVWQKLCIKEISVLFITQMVFDIAYILLSHKFEQYGNYFADAFTLAQWIIIYCVFTYKQKSLWGNKKIAAISALALGVLLMTSMYGNAVIDKAFLEYGDKYASLDQIMSTVKMNLAFIFQLKNLLLDCLIGVVLLIAHSLMSGSSDKKDDERERNKISFAVFKIMTCVIFALLIFFVNYTLMPYNAITKTDVYGGIRPAGNKAVFNASSRELTVERGGEAVFNAVRHTIIYSGKKLKSFTTLDGDAPNGFVIEGNSIVVLDPFEEKTINGFEIKIYHDMAACYIKDGKPVVVLFEDEAELYKMIQ